MTTVLAMMSFFGHDRHVCVEIWRNGVGKSFRRDPCSWGTLF